MANAILSDEEIQQAMAEVESLPNGELEQIPSLDDGSGAAPVVVPVPTMSPRVARTIGPTAGTGQSTPSAAAPAARWSWLARLRGLFAFRWRRRSAQKEAAPQTGVAAPAPIESAAPETGVAAPATPAATPSAAAPHPTPVAARSPRAPVRLGSILYRSADLTLAALNYPFRWLSPAGRRTLGPVAMMTIVVSVTAAYVLPALFPRRTAIEFVEECKREALMARERAAAEKAAKIKAAQEAAEGEAKSEHAAPPPAGGKGGGH